MHALVHAQTRKDDSALRQLSAGVPPLGFCREVYLPNNNQPVCDVDRQAVEEEREPFAAVLLLDPKYHAVADCVLSQ